jgi:GNAT superfamily N-acetyltransferase
MSMAERPVDGTVDGSLDGAADTGWHVEAITTADTHSVRLAVLRADTPTKDVEFAEDELPGVVHLGVRLDGVLVATSTWIPRPLPAAAVRETGATAEVAASAVQLRGMATMQHLQGRGVGSAIIAAGCAHARRLGASIVWANARDRALAFYEREGFVAVGDGFVDAVTQLPHHVVVRHL